MKEITDVFFFCAEKLKEISSYVSLQVMNEEEFNIAEALRLSLLEARGQEKKEIEINVSDSWRSVFMLGKFNVLDVKLVCEVRLSDALNNKRQ